jgi:hypothetical protein
MILHILGEKNVVLFLYEILLRYAPGGPIQICDGFNITDYFGRNSLQELETTSVQHLADAQSSQSGIPANLKESLRCACWHDAWRLTRAICQQIPRLLARLANRFSSVPNSSPV